MRHVKRAIRADLHRFKAYVMMNEEADGDWRGTIEDGEVKAGGRRRRAARSASRRAARSGVSRSSGSDSKSGSGSKTQPEPLQGGGSSSGNRRTASKSSS